MKYPKGKGLLDQYLYAKKCLDSVYSHIGFWVSLGEKVLIGGIFVKVFDIQNYYLLGSIGLAGIIIAIYLGHLMLKKGVIERQNTIDNEFNKEIRELLKNTKK